jgi:hypothetical protein
MASTKSKKIADKLAALKAELKEAQHAEVDAARKAARREFTRAARKAGLLRLVAGGAVAPEALEAEFRAVAERLKNSASATAANEALPAAAAEDQPPAAGTEGDEHKPFWKR